MYNSLLAASPGTKLRNDCRFSGHERAGRGWTVLRPLHAAMIQTSRDFPSGPASNERYYRVLILRTLASAQMKHTGHHFPSTHICCDPAGGTIWTSSIQVPGTPDPNRRVYATLLCHRRSLCYTAYSRNNKPWYTECISQHQGVNPHPSLSPHLQH